MRNRIFTLVAAAWLCLIPASAQVESSDPELEKFLMISVLDGLYELHLPDQVVDKLLARDPQTQMPYSFIYGCPVCHSCYDALALYRIRPTRLGHTVDSPQNRDFGGTVPDQIVAELGSDDPARRTATFAVLVKQIIKKRLAETSWNDAQRQSWQLRFEAAARVGQRALKAGQTSGMETYQMMWSCQMCDAVTKPIPPNQK
ncbi:hypothetical protein IV102_03770 [bacterium]|nr:hypothetical protein [bacterium]